MSPTRTRTPQLAARKANGGNDGNDGSAATALATPSAVPPTTNGTEPMIRLDPSGTAPILSYNVPEPTSYVGTNIIEMEFEGEDVFMKAGTGEPMVTFDGYTEAMIEDAMYNHFYDPKLFMYVKVNTGTIFWDHDTMKVISTELPITPQLEGVTPKTVFAKLKTGYLLNVYLDMYGVLASNWTAIPGSKPRILLVERYRMSNFLGAYGAGRTIKTFSLLPGEKTRISMKTYSRKENDVKNASSILDSFDKTSSQDFEKSVQSEQSDKRSSSENMSYYVDAEASFNWGWGSAGVKAGVKGGTNSSRDEFAKNLSNATQKHASKASAKRDVQINTTSEVKEQTGEETEMVRELQNINVGRTLNFVFRQMNQEFITILHLVDVRVAFWDGDPANKREFTLPEMDKLLNTYIKPAKRDLVRNTLLGELAFIVDYRDNPQSLVEERTLPAAGVAKSSGRKSATASDVGARYYRVRKDLISSYEEPENKLKIDVPGIILFANKNVLRTDGVIVDAILGSGDGLDAYSHGLQDEAVRERAVNNALKQAQVERERLGQLIVSQTTTDKVKAFHDCFVVPAPEPAATPAAPPATK
jgi:hypothetical protein